MHGKQSWQKAWIDTCWVRDAILLGWSPWVPESFPRPLPGLKLLNPPSTPLPELYADPLYVRASRWTLSTSAVFSERFKEYGWGAVVPEGFGVAYVTGFDGDYTVSSLVLFVADPLR